MYSASVKRCEGERSGCRFPPGCAEQGKRFCLLKTDVSTVRHVLARKKAAKHTGNCVKLGKPLKISC